MRPSFRLALLVSLALLPACTRTEPTPASPGEPPAPAARRCAPGPQKAEAAPRRPVVEKAETHPTKKQHSVAASAPATKADPAPLQTGDYTAEVSGNLGRAAGGGAAYDVPFWMREGFSVVVATAHWPGRREAGPVFVVLTRHPLPSTPEGAGIGQWANGRCNDRAFPADCLRLRGGVYNGKTSTAYRYVLCKEDFREEFSLLVGNPQGRATPYDLADGRLFLVDAAAGRPRVEQVKADVRRVTPDRETCVRVLRDLAGRSEAARSLLEEALRR
jgi:hypothetical protein